MGKRKLFFGILLSISLFTGCSASSTPASESSGEEPNIVTFFAMDTVMELRAYGEPQVLEQAKERVAALESLFSATDAGSEIHAANQNGEAVLSTDTAAILSAGLELCRQTGGTLDLSIYPIVRAWGFTTDHYRIPAESELSELMSHVGYEQIAFDPDSRSVTLAPGMEIDLGSIAKGYTGDQLTALLRDAGVTSALLNLGGNIQALGSKPDGSPWRIAIKNPGGDGNLGILSIADRAVVTSGGYERYFEEDGEIYWHIIDPATGCPAHNGLISVTIVGESGVLCDGLSTALFVMGPEAAADFWRASDNFEAVLVQEDGSVSITEGLESAFSFTDSYAGAPLTVIHRD